LQTAKVKEAFAKLDGEIAELTTRVAGTSGDARREAAKKLSDLTAYRDTERVRFLAIQARAPLQSGVELRAQPEGTREKVADKLEDAAMKVGDELQDAADAVRDGKR
jgi:hypothetical protein